MEATVLKAKNNLSLLLHKAEQGEEVVIRRGRNGARGESVLASRSDKRPKVWEIPEAFPESPDVRIFAE